MNIRALLITLSFNLAVATTAFTTAHAAEVKFPMDLVSWQTEQNEFECLLYHELPNKHGKFFFHAEADDKVSAVLRVGNKPIQQAQLFQLSPPWSTPAEHIAIDEASQTRQGYALFDAGIEQLLSALHRGAWLRVSHMESVTSHGDAFILPSTRIDSALVRFNQCRTALPKMSYRQARDIVLPFEFGQRMVSSEQRQTLRSLASYLQVDKKIERVLIDGHTDNLGTSISNLQMSRMRADDVASALIDLGVSKRLIETRGHGARYPVSSNETEFGQAENRRVTIRLVRSTPPQPLSAMQMRMGK